MGDFKRIAVLIDAENAPAKYIELLMKDIKIKGIITYNRAYADWTSDRVNQWKKKLLDNSITPIQAFSHTEGKNSSDSSLIIDAMDILHLYKIDVICLVSSDSDFTKLATRIRQDGIMVIGYGEKKTPKALIAACNEFNYFEDMDKEVEQELEDTSLDPSHKEGVVPIKVIERDVIEILKRNGGTFNVSKIGNILKRQHPDFSYTAYGFNNLRRLLSNFKQIDIERYVVNDSLPEYLAILGEDGNIQKDVKKPKKNKVAAKKPKATNSKQKDNK